MPCPICLFARGHHINCTRRPRPKVKVEPVRVGVVTTFAVVRLGRTLNGDPCPVLHLECATREEAVAEHRRILGKCHARIEAWHSTKNWTDEEVLPLAEARAG